MKRSLKWILILTAMITVLSLAAGTAGAEVKRTLQLELPVNPPRRSAASVSGPNADNPVTCEEYTFTVNNGTDANVASYEYWIGLLEGGSTTADVVYHSPQTASGTFSYTFYLPGTYVLFVDRYDSDDQPAGSQLQRMFEISENGSAANPLSTKINEIVSGLQGTDWEKALSLHDWLTGHACYDYQFEYYGPDGVLLHGTGVCNSYARAYELLCKAAGIPVSRVKGKATNSSGQPENHAWNAIQLLGQWYLVDVTWDDPSNKGSTAIVSGHEGHDYFCLNDDLMGLNHDNDGSLFAAGQCSSLAMNYLVYMGDSYGMGNSILLPNQPIDSYTGRITARLEQGETEFTVPCEDTFYALSNVTDSGYSYSSAAAGSARAVRGWTLLAFWMSENGFELEGAEGEDPVSVQPAVSYDRAGNQFVCSSEAPAPTWDWSYVEGEQMISITGSGTLSVDGDAPWLGKGYNIRRVMVGKEINRIGANVFAGLDSGVRIDFLQDTVPEFLGDTYGDAFGDTVAVCRYLSRDLSWRTLVSTERVNWVWMPTFNFQAAGTFDSLWFEKDAENPGWSVTVNADGAPVPYTQMPPATAHELVGYCHDVFLNALPSGADLAVLNGVESDLWYLYFASGCSGSLALNSANCSAMPLSISSFAPDLELTVTCTETCSGETSLQELYVTNGVVDYTGDVQKLLLNLTPSGQTAAVTVCGTIRELAYYAEGSEDPSPYRGTLTVTGGITGGLVYDGWDGTMAIPGVTDAYPLRETPGQQFGSLTGLDNTPVILYDDTRDVSFLNPEIATEGGTVPTHDMFRLRYILGGRGNNYLMMTPLEDAGIGSEVIDFRIEDYNEDFWDDLRENVIWGSRTELYVDGTDITLPGSADGRGLAELGAGGNCTVTVQCPVETLSFQPDPVQKNHIIFNLEDSVSSAYLQPNNCTLDLTLRDGGSIGSGTWKQLLRDYRSFGPCSAGAGETLQVAADSALRVMSWTNAEQYASILPSDTKVTEAAGTLAMADMIETALTPEDYDALAAVVDGNGTFSLDTEAIAWVFDVSVNAYSVDENGEAAIGASISDLGGNEIPIQISNVTGNPDACVIRLHEENGVLTARKLDTTVTADTAGFESDLFSTYLLATPVEVVPEMEAPDFVTPADLKVIETEAFRETAARVVMITENVEEVHDLAFKDSGVLQVIILNAETEISDTAFDGCDSLTVFGQPGGKVESWAEKNGFRFYPIL